jgi:hypothetical protein
MQVLGLRSPVNERFSKLALGTYEQDSEHSLQKVHGVIRSFATRKNSLSKSGRVIEEGEMLINVHRFKLTRLMSEDKR